MREVVFNPKIMFLGGPCLHGHIYGATGKTARYDVAGACVTCKRAGQAAAYPLRKKDRLFAARKYYRKHRDKRLADAKAYRERLGADGKRVLRKKKAQRYQDDPAHRAKRRAASRADYAKHRERRLAAKRAAYYRDLQIFVATPT